MQDASSGLFTGVRIGPLGQTTNALRLFTAKVLIHHAPPPHSRKFSSNVIAAASVRRRACYAKAHPSELNFAAVHGAIPHLAAELLKLRAGIDLVHVPYKTESEMIAAVLSGQVQLCFVNVASILPLIAERRVRAIVVTSATRQPELAEVPTMIEGGLSEYVVTSFFGVAAPAGTPSHVIEQLNSAINLSLRSPDVQTSLLKFGVHPAGGNARGIRGVLGN